MHFCDTVVFILLALLNSFCTINVSEHFVKNQTRFSVVWLDRNAGEIVKKPFIFSRLKSKRLFSSVFSVHSEPFLNVSHYQTEVLEGQLLNFSIKIFLKVMLNLIPSCSTHVNYQTSNEM